MVGGTISPQILRAAIRMVVPGYTSVVMLSLVTLNNFFSSAIYQMQNEKLKMKNHFAAKRMDAMIFEISSASFNSSSIFFLSTSIVSRIKQSQYFVSLADFKAI